MSPEELQVALVSVSMSCTSTWNTTVWPNSRRAGASWAPTLQPNWNASSPPRSRNQGLCVPRIQSPRYGLRLVFTPETILRWHRDIIRRRWAAQSMRSQDRPASHPAGELARVGSERGGADGTGASEGGGNRRRAAQSCGTPRAAMPRNFVGSTAGCGFLYPRPVLALRTRPTRRQLTVMPRGSTASRWAVLAAVSERNLTVARVLEAHGDTLAILAESGAPVPDGTWEYSPPKPPAPAESIRSWRRYGPDGC